MNVILNTEEAHVVRALVSSTVLDHVDLSDAAKERIREWRTARAPGTRPLDAFTETLNESLGNFIDDRTRRMLRQRGKVKVRE